MLERPNFIEFLGYLVSGVLLAIPVLYWNAKFAFKLGLIDWPKARGMTAKQVPIIGYGLVLLSIGFLATLCFVHHLTYWPLATGCVMALMGYIDDRRPMSALQKIFIQFATVATVVIYDPEIALSVSDRFGWQGQVVAGVFILGLMNAINFIDGIDGSAGLAIMFGTVGIFLMGYNKLQTAGYLVYSMFLLGTLGVFFYLNVFQKKGFIGNIGSYFFGYLMAVMHASIPIDTSDVFCRFSLSALCFLIPVADAVTVMVTRLVTIRSPFQADKGHLHHRLLQSSLPLRWVLLSFCVISTFSVTLALHLSRVPVYYGSRLPIYICISHVTITAILIWMIEKASRRRIHAHLTRLDGEIPVLFSKYRLETEDGKAPSPSKLMRIEARISAEIRITDMCFSEAPDVLFLTYESAQPPGKGITRRIELILKQEKMIIADVLEQGQFVKVERFVSKEQVG